VRPPEKNPISPPNAAPNPEASVPAALAGTDAPPTSPRWGRGGHPTVRRPHRRRGHPFDVLGLSYYPFGNGSLEQLSQTLADLADRYHRDILLAETAYPWTLEQGDHLENLVTSADQLPDAARFPPTPAGQAAYYEALRAVVASVPGGHGLGFLAWEPGWLPPVGWVAGEGNHYANLGMFSWDGNGLPSLGSLASPR
jgi:arabinogalactan endo-1,4-beta-galactosidase